MCHLVLFNPSAPAQQTECIFYGSEGLSIGASLVLDYKQ